MTDKEILDELERRCSRDFVYYDNACLRGHSPDLFAHRCYAKETLDFIKERRKK